MTTRKTVKKTAKKNERPKSKFDIKRGEILERLADGETLRAICAADDMPNASEVCRKALHDDDFSQQYARAREIGARIMVEDMLAIADDSSNDWITRTKENGEAYEVVNHDHISRAKLRWEARRWAVSKALPKIYGDKLNVEHSGSVEHKHRSAAELAQDLANMGLDPAALIQTTPTHMGVATSQ